jgi:hypothetical protein
VACCAAQGVENNETDAEFVTLKLARTDVGNNEVGAVEPERGGSSIE